MQLWIIIIFITNLSMSKGNDLNIENVLRKYEHRQERLLEDIHKSKNDYIDTARNNEGHPKSGANTPQFSHTVSRKEINRNL